MRRTNVPALLVVTIPSLASTAVLDVEGERKAPMDARAAFERLKGLTGSWKVADEGQGGDPSTVTDHVTAAGSAVVETLFPGTDHERVPVDHMDGDDLRMTHDRAAGNQPRFKLDRTASSPDDLRFVFDGGTNLDPARDLHVHEGRLDFKDGGRVEGVWAAFKDGKPAGSHSFLLEKQ